MLRRLAWYISQISSNSMIQSKPLLFQAAQTGGLAVMLFFSHITGTAARGADLKPNQVLPNHTPLSRLATESMSVSEADANTIERWLLGDSLNSIFGIAPFFSERIEEVLAQPNAKVELARIVARQDLPPRLRVYAQEMLIKAGHSPDPVLLEVYCQTLQDSVKGKLSYDLWGVPGYGTGSFGKTLVGYGRTALPCLFSLLSYNNRLEYSSSEWRAISNMYMYYRVSDLAAYFITQILNLPYNNDSDPAVRDKQIQDLRRQLATSPENESGAQTSPVKYDR